MVTGKPKVLLVTITTAEGEQVYSGVLAEKTFSSGSIGYYGQANESSIMDGVFNRGIHIATSIQFIGSKPEGKNGAPVLVSSVKKA